MSNKKSINKNAPIQEFLKKTSLGDIFVSYEITANIKEMDIKIGNLNHALFVSIVWSGKLARFKLLENDSSLTGLFDLLGMLKNEKIRTIIHLTCYEMSSVKLNFILKKLHSFDVVDLLTLRGDGDNFLEFNNALDLMKSINDNNFYKFYLVCAGYPQGHPESLSISQDFEVLQKKVESGAELIITQFFFDALDFIKFVENCHHVYNIHIPVIPGVLLAPSYTVLEKISAIAKVSLPFELTYLRAFDDKQFEEYYVEFVIKLVSTILEYKYLDCDICSFCNVKGIHFFTMNNFDMTNAIVDFLRQNYNLIVN